MIVTTFRKINAFLLELFFPRACLSCKKPRTYFCINCAQKLCGEGQVHHGTAHIKSIIACCHYEDLKKVIHYFKYYFDSDLRVPLGLIMKHQFEKRFKSDNIVLIPVPLHKKRLKYRSFNQAELLSREIMEPMNALIRTKHTSPQAKLGREERLKNLTNAFSLLPGIDLRGKTAVIIDDVCTTGSTLEECAKALEKACPKEIYGLVIAKGC